MKKFLVREYEIKDLGALRYFLSMDFAKSKKAIFVSQRKYVLDLLEEIDLLGCKLVETPVEPNLRLQLANADNVVNQEQYQRLVGRFIYISYSIKHSVCNECSESNYALTRERTFRSNLLNS